MESLNESITNKINAKTKEKAEIIYDEAYQKLCIDTDKVFAILLVFQWIVAVIVAIVFSPKTWIGAQGMVSVHIYASVIIGGFLTCFPLYLMKKEPGAEVNRYANVIAQALYSVLFIHLSGGRIETHFHVFGSLAFFAFYRDAKLLIVGSLVVALDHFVRGIWFPQSAFGILTQSEWRWMEHAAWVIFEDFFLVYSCIRSQNEMQLVALKTAEVMMQHEHAEEIVEERTKKIQEQQMQLINSSKMSEMGIMAAGIAHEINNPLTIIASSNKLLQRVYASEVIDHEKADKLHDTMDKTVKRIGKIILGLRTVSRDTTGEEMTLVSLRDLMVDVIGLCGEKFKVFGIDLRINLEDPIFDTIINIKRVQISQVFINLLGNAFDAIESLPEKWVKVDCTNQNGFIEFKVSDSGPGISKELQEKIFHPFFTTKPIGKGTGLGLSLSVSIIKDHDGSFTIDQANRNTCFVINLPVIKKAA